MRQALIITIGAPGCGKSTWAERICAKKGFIEVNRDNLRRLMTANYTTKVQSTPELEKEVTRVHTEMLTSALKHGKTVVCSDTNINPDTRKRLETIAEGYGVAVFYKHFRDSKDWMLLQDRNKTRPEKDRVPFRVLKDFYDRYREQNFLLADRFSTQADGRPRPAAYIFDIDGTIADHTGLRSPFEWYKVGVDRVKHDVANIANTLYASGFYVILVSGRDGSCYQETVKWLNTHGIQYHHLIMRPAKSTEKDSILKYDIYKNYIEPHFNVVGVFDDRDQVVQMWRSIGLTCLQVAEGKF